MVSGEDLPDAGSVPDRSGHQGTHDVSASLAVDATRPVNPKRIS
jgi:hypothetical protein